MKERYRIEILDKKTKQKQIFLVNGFSQDTRYHMVPVQLETNKGPAMMECGLEQVDIRLPFPKLIVPVKRKRKVRRKKRKIKKIRN